MYTHNMYMHMSTPCTVDTENATCPRPQSKTLVPGSRRSLGPAENQSFTLALLTGWVIPCSRHVGKKTI